MRHLLWIFALFVSLAGHLVPAAAAQRVLLTAEGQASAGAAPATSNQTTSPATSGLTTAEAIAAELRAAQEAMPAPSLSTFAPDCLNPANALRSRRRLAGANLAGFKAMASGMFRN